MSEVNCWIWVCFFLLKPTLCALCLPDHLVLYALRCWHLVLTLHSPVAETTVPHYQAHWGQHCDSPAVWTRKVSEWKNLQMLQRGSWHFSRPAHTVLSRLLWMRCVMTYYEAKGLLLFRLLQNIKKLITKLHSTWLCDRKYRESSFDSKRKPHTITFFVCSAPVTENTAGPKWVLTNPTHVQGWDWG